MKIFFALLASATFQNAVASDEIKGAIITALITGLISIVGFIITYVSMKKSFKNELKKQRDSVALEKMSTMPFEVLVLMDEMINSKNKTDKKQQESHNATLKHFGEIMNTIYSYGSEDAIRIVSTMQRENYAANGDKDKLDKYRLISLYVLLATQIKYDVTEIAVCPKLWYEMRITDFSKNKDEFKKSNNQLVKELKLNDEFKITD